LDESLKKLYDEFKAAFDQDELRSFRRLFKEECTFESLPIFFCLLMDLTKYLLNKIQSKTVDKDENKIVEKGNKGMVSPDSDIKIDVNDERNGNTKFVDPFSTLQCLPLEVASKVFSFRPIKECLKADQHGNKFLLSSAVQYLEKFEVVYNVSMTVMKNGNDMKCKRINQNIAHLQFTGIDSTHLLSKMVKNLLAFAKPLEYIKKMSFEGQYVHCLIYDYGLSEALLQLTKTCEELKNIEFESEFGNNYGNRGEVRAKNLLLKVKAINKVTIKNRNSGTTFDYTL